MKNSILELDDVVNKVNSQCLNSTEYKLHQSQGTLEQHYKQILSTAIADMARLPLSRVSEGLEPLEDPQQVSHTFARLARILSITFGKSYRQVEIDLVEVLDEFPVHDYRTAAYLRDHNKLH